MSKRTVEEYRISFVLNGVKRKLLRHSIEEDESLLVQIRSAPRSRHVGSFTFDSRTWSAQQLTTRIDRRSLSYHPSGRINVKSHKGKHEALLQAPPLAQLQAPIFLLFHSAASPDQFDIDNQPTRYGDACLDLNGLRLSRIHSECFVGPKGAFSADFQWPFGPAQQIVYAEALYDVCYIVGEGPPVPDLTINGVEMNRTVLSGAINQSQLPQPAQVATETAPEMFASPLAVARQLRALFESRAERLVQALGGVKGFYQIKMMTTSDGVVAAVSLNRPAHNGFPCRNLVFSKFSRQ